MDATRCLHVTIAVGHCKEIGILTFSLDRKSNKKIKANPKAPPVLPANASPCVAVLSNYEHAECYEVGALYLKEDLRKEA